LENRPLDANLKREAVGASVLGLAATMLFGVWLIFAVGGAEEGVAIAATVYCLFLAYIGRFLAQHPHPALGAANRVTIFRCALIANFAALSLQPEDVAAYGWIVAPLLIVAFALDGVDGWLARRSGFASRFGARFDQELDAFYTLILSFLVLQLGKAGPWVLLAGLWHYFFLALLAAAPGLRADLPPARWRKAVCVINIASLILCATPAVQPPISQAIAAGAVLVLSASFLTDIFWLAGRRPRRAPIA
jgi:phosphatidylglycerophosphate synthase